MAAGRPVLDQRGPPPPPFHKFSQRYAASSDTEEWNRVCGMAAATTFRHHRRRHSRARPACTHTACFRLPALNSGGGHCIYMLHTETANKRGADLNNVSSNSVLARCDVAPLPSSPLLLPIYAYPSHVQDDRIIVSKRKNNEFLYNV